MDLLPFAKLLELLALDHSSSEKRMIFAPWWLKFSGCFITYMGAHFPQLNWITQSGLAPFPGCQGSCGIVPNGAAGSVVSFSIHEDLKC